MKLIDIFNTLVPQALQNDPLFKDSLQVFIEVLTETSSVTNDMESYFEANNTVLTNELVKIFLENLNYSINQLTTNPNIVDRVKIQHNFYELDLPTTILPSDISKYINKEHITISKELKQKKGKQSALRYFYNFVRQLNLEGSYTYQNIDNDLEITEIEPFQFDVKGSLFKEVYATAVKPIAHPLGFAYTYQQLLKTLLEDYYSNNVTYNIQELKIYCTYENNILDLSDRKVINIEINYISEGYQQKEVYFEDGGYLIQYYDKNIVLYNQDNSINTDFGNLCILSLKYTISVEDSFNDSAYIEEEFRACDYYNILNYPQYGSGGARNVKYGQCGIRYNEINKPLKYKTNNLFYGDYQLKYGIFGTYLEPGELEIQDDIELTLEKDLVYKSKNLYYGEYNFKFGQFTTYEKVKIDMPI